MPELIVFALRQAELTWHSPAMEVSPVGSPFWSDSTFSLLIPALIACVVGRLILVDYEPCLVLVIWLAPRCGVPKADGYDKHSPLRPSLDLSESRNRTRICASSTMCCVRARLRLGR
jgi:hypothetical protein